MSDAPSLEQSPIRKVVAASMVGTTIEWYDFFVFGSAAALVFNKLFFPDYDPLVGTILAFATYAVGFVARPLGGLVFGHFGDRIGRKKMLVASLLIMGVGTFTIGLLPPYSVIGVWAPILLVVCRLLQGFAVGGEWGGAVLMVAEHGDPARRGFWSSWPQAGVPAGNLLAVGALALMSGMTTDSSFEAWGWRVPFLLSAALVVVGLWIRMNLAESPVFQRIRAEVDRTREKQTAPILHVVRRYRKEVLVAMGARVAENISYYVFTVFVLTYVTKELGLSKDTALTAVLVASAIQLVAIPMFGALSDRVGRRPVYLFGAGGLAVWAFGFFLLLDTKSTAGIMVAIAVGLVCHAAMYGPQAAFFSELFGTGVRYSGASIGYQLASVFAGSLAPIISLALLTSFGTSFPVSLYLVAAAAITIVAVVVATETRHRDLAADTGLASAESAGTPPVAP